MIPYTDFGGDGKNLHFLHANGYPPACYLPLIELLKSQYHVSAMHLRALWPNSDPKEIRDWRPLADDFMLYLDQQADGRSIAIGHSVGAIIALRAALRRPDYFKALILMDPVLFLPNFIALWNLAKVLGLGYKLHPLINNALKRRRKFDDLGKLFAAYRRKQIFRYFSDNSLWAYIHGMVKPSGAQEFELVYSPEWEAQIYDSGIWKDMDIWRGLPDLKIPILIIRGAETDTFAQATANRFKRIRPTTEIITIEKSTHLVPLEKPQETYQTIHAFLKEIV
jgi:pimeloyl-ACP methyl ester carboxylesterase